MTLTAAERIFRHVEHTGGCWIWTGAVGETGYGKVTYDGRVWRAHRLSYATFVGPIPDGLSLDHLCRVRNCVNPEHLEPVDQRTNLHRSPLTNAGKTHCKRGHEFTPENTRMRWTEGRTKRVCVACLAYLELRKKARRAAA